MANKYSQCAPNSVALLHGEFKKRYELNRTYMLSLRNDNLLQNHYLEASMGTFWQLRNTLHGAPDHGDDRHWGWESPTCLVRGQFLGHWLSAAGRIVVNGDPEVKAKLEKIVAELALCQERNGNGWVFSIPEKYLRWTAEGKSTWAPHYVVHKTLMGLVDVHRYTGSELALEILQKAAKWFHKWTAQFSRQKMDDILDVETGGMLEVWANLYELTHSKMYEDLMERYTRSRLFDPLLAGKDPLTNMHANTTIPEIHGAARAYEVTGDKRWRRIVEAYWKCAVDERGTFCTCGQTSGEIWTPPHEFTARLGDKNQEHCTVYNMIRLADYLFRWTGDVKYADYIERNLHNGILAQQNPKTGMVAYFLPMEAGAKKLWGTPTYDFWCCHGTLVQAHTAHNAWIYYRNDDELTVCQYIESKLKTVLKGVEVAVEQNTDYKVHGGVDSTFLAAGLRHRPDRWSISIKVKCAQSARFTLKLRIPSWTAGKPVVTVNGKLQSKSQVHAGFCEIARQWKDDVVRIELPKALSVSEVPDEPERVAFLDGPIVLAGLCDEERALIGDKNKPADLLVPDNERQWGVWLSGYRVNGQPRGLRFVPLNEIVDERYTVYFPVQSAGGKAKRSSKRVAKRAGRRR